MVGEDWLLAWGAVGGVIHFAIGGAMIAGIFSVVDARPRGEHPGFAYRHYGRRDVTALLGEHLTFGVRLGPLYPAPYLGLKIAW